MSAPLLPNLYICTGDFCSAGVCFICRSLEDNDKRNAEQIEFSDGLNERIL